MEAFGPKLDLIRALESGRIVSRDLGGSDPERMAPPRYLFGNPSFAVWVIRAVRFFFLILMKYCMKGGFFILFTNPKLEILHIVVTHRLS